MLNDLELTILSLVSEAPRHKTQIEHALDLRGVREWLMIESSSLNYVLEKLEKQTLVARDGGEAAAAIFSITEGGRGVLQTAVAERLTQPRALGTGFELALANLGVLKPAQVYNALRQHHSRLAHKLHQIEDNLGHLTEADEQLVPLRDIYARAMYSHAQAIMQAELAWIEAFTAEWLKRFPAAELMNTEADSSGGAPTLIHQKTKSNSARERAKHAGRFERPGDK